jgi:putative hydrolase of the HAD superfamily
VKAIKGVIADFGGVLTNPLPGVMRDFCRAEGLAEEALVDLFTRDSRGRAAFADLERGDISQNEWEAVTADLLGVPAAGLLRRVLATLAPAEPMLEVIAAARAAGYLTACLTNSFGLEPFDPYGPWALEKRFDVVVVSERERLRKPDVAIYQRTLERLGLPGPQCLYLDDIEANLAPARALGMSVLLVDDPEDAARRVAAELGLAEPRSRPS